MCIFLKLYNSDSANPGHSFIHSFFLHSNEGLLCGRPCVRAQDRIKIIESQNFASGGTIFSAEGLPFTMTVRAKLKISSNHGS